MVKTIGVISIKGGVGKTTIAASLASDLVNHYGKKVLLVDANYSAPNLGLHMNISQPSKTIHQVLDNKAKINSAVHSRYGVDVIPGSYIYDKDLDFLSLKDKLSKIKSNYDFVILDSSPNLNDEVLSTITASDNLFIVSTPDLPTLSCSANAARIAKKKGTPISGIILNKIRDPKYELSLSEMEEVLNIPVVAKIPDDKLNIRALFTMIPTSIYNRNSSFSKEISKLSAALIGKKEDTGFLRKLFGNFKREEVNRQVLKESFYSSAFE